MKFPESREAVLVRTIANQTLTTSRPPNQFTAIARRSGSQVANPAEDTLGGVLSGRANMPLVWNCGKGRRGRFSFTSLTLGDFGAFAAVPRGASDTLAGAVGRVVSLRNRIAIKKVAVDPNVVNIRSNQYQRVTEP